MMARSFSRTDTGAPAAMPQVQAASHKAGHTRLVNSGNRLVAIRRCSASSHRPWYTRSFHSGIRLCSGQPLAIPPIIMPLWQKGTPQSMQRAPWACCSSSGSGR